MKVSSSDILDILRRFEIASEDNVPKNISIIKSSHPSPINTLIEFSFVKSKYFLLFDDTVSSDVDYLNSQILPKGQDINGELINTKPSVFHGKDFYLFAVNGNKNRLDSELVKLYPEYSRGTWQKYIKAGYVKVGGKVIKTPKYNLKDGDKITLNIPKNNDYSKHKLPIIYQDDNVIVVDKPAGVLTHAKGVLGDEFTVGDFFSRYTSYNTDTNRPGIVHRLDRNTSGILIGAKNTETAKLLQKQFADRKTKKTYYAIVENMPKLNKANIDLPIGRNPSKPSTFKVDASGKSALTYYEVVAQNDGRTLVKLQPKTGRTHQLRVHMQYIGSPILGDVVYGKKADRLYLHAYSLEITIPKGDRQVFVSPLPDEFKKYFPEFKA